MSIRKLGLAAVVASGIGGTVLAQETSSNTHVVGAGDTLSQIAASTGTTVVNLMTLNPQITDRFGTVCKSRISQQYFCTGPEHTIFTGETITITPNSEALGDTNDSVSGIDAESLRAAGINNPEIAEEIIRAGMVSIPGITPEDAISIVREIQEIPRYVNLGIIIDVSGSTSDKRFQITKFLQFVLEDRRLGANILEGDDSVRIGNNTCYGYSSDVEPIDCTSEMGNVGIGDGVTENTVSAINRARSDGAEYVIVITDEPGDDTELAVDSDNVDRNIVFMIQDPAFCPNDCGNENPFFGKPPLSNHARIINISHFGG